MAANLKLLRPTVDEHLLTKKREAHSAQKSSRTKWGFRIGGALLVIGFVASGAIKRIKRTPPQRADFPPALLSRLEMLRSILTEVYPLTRGQWMDCLRRGFDPEKELIWWERVAGCYTAFSATRTLSQRQKQAAFKIIFGLSSGMSERDLAGEFAKLPQSDVIQLAGTVRSLPSR